MRRILHWPVPDLPKPATVIVDPERADLIDLRKRALLAEWHRARFKRGRIPKRADLDRDLLKDIGDYLIDVAIELDGRLRFRSYGLGIAAAFGRDMTGKSLADLPAAAARFFARVYGIAQAERVPCATRHAPDPTIPVSNWLRLVTPLDEAGEGRVTAFLCCNVPLDPGARAT
jgi:hypothetical protein